MSQQLRTLAPRHYAAIRLKVAGASGGEIAETLGVETRTVYLWMGDPLVKGELARQLELISDEFARQLSQAALVAISQLRTHRVAQAGRSRAAGLQSEWLLELPRDRNWRRWAR